MSKRKRNYTTDFKKKAIELSYSRGSIAQVYRELDIPSSVLSRWRREFSEYGKNSFPGRGKPKLIEEQREIAALEKELRDMTI
ncbi:transposase [Snuella sedimenti]|uniref:Transposase n=1 Tax=Snuella sedimenti TaxID=2798802 RepID=A0A8J7IHV6_9FLAO|nr:transposase [Snuella sedimenti]MBJ6368883.1 transposase [Snuella sedimenti]